MNLSLLTTQEPKCAVNQVQKLNNPRGKLVQAHSKGLSQTEFYLQVMNDQINPTTSGNYKLTNIDLRLDIDLAVLNHNVVG